MSYADKRLLKDLKGIRKANTSLFAVHLHAENLREWHINFFPPAAYGNIAVHAIFSFADDFPQSPPSATFPTDVRYQLGLQTSEGELCLSILSNFTDYHTEWESSSQAWSPSYTMHDVLLSIYSVLFDESAHSANDISAIRQAAKTYVCRTCGHNGSSSWLPASQEPLEGSTAAATVGQTAADEDHVEVLADLGSNPSIPTCDGAITQQQQAQIRDGICCYVSQASANELLESDSDLVFGFGIKVHTHATNRLNKVETPCEYMSLEAWDAGIRKSIYNLELDYFLPLYLTADHYRRTADCRQQLFQTLAERMRVSVHAAMHRVLCSAMAHLVVNALQTRIRGDASAGGISLSGRMIEGYMQLWRLTVALCKEHPELQHMFHARLESFLEHPERRNKTFEPNLGELYSCIPFTRFEWADCVSAILGESSVRQWRWMLQEYPELNQTCIDPDWKLNITAEATRVSRGFQAFNKYMVSDVMGRASPEAMLHSADARYGVPAAALSDRIVQACIDASEIGLWTDYLNWMGCAESIAEADIVAKLDQAQQASRDVGYSTSTGRPRNALERVDHAVRMQLQRLDEARPELRDNWRQAPRPAPRAIPVRHEQRPGAAARIPRDDQVENWRRPVNAPGRYVPPGARRQREAAQRLNWRR
eukprot:TRINITY_DN1950_c0_g1_i1.p1 TRINITY_DN1950_c0_g1~~TRINITY_DN1950_c0_g1_i1.p1  ORF type:complete len:651 (+),score=140.42 TRINITY_DN1950_c0_g1_i1:226-2178(+)